MSGTEFIFILFMANYHGSMIEVPNQPKDMGMQQCELLRQYTEQKVTGSARLNFSCVPVVKQ